MAKRDNHYEAAFEAYLRQRRIAYVAVDETKRAQLADGSIKSLDFIVSPSGPSSWLVDVKGRLFPGGRRKQYWRNWSTREDLRGLDGWERLFGGGFHGLFVFAYHVVGDRAPVASEQLFPLGGRWYAFLAVRLCDYAAFARPISSAWDTLALPARRFRELAVPVDELWPPEGTGERFSRQIDARRAPPPLSTPPKALMP